jgi:hypothetical protein
MTFTIATAEQDQAPATPVRYDGKVTFRNFGERADRKARQIIASIETCELPSEVDDTLIENDEVIDALLLDYPDLYEGIRTAADDHKAILTAGLASADADAPAPMTASASNVLNKTF